MLASMLLTGLLTTATVTHAFELCESQYKACVSVRCDAVFYSNGVRGFVACTLACKDQLDNCQEAVRSY